MDEVVHHRFRWYHGRRLKALREKHLQPFIERLVEEARHGPMFDGAFLYRLELEKFRCIREYFSYSFIADRDGNFSFKPWMDICIRLLEHIVEEGRGISDEQSLHVNTYATWRHCGRSFDKLLHGCASAIGNERT